MTKYAHLRDRASSFVNSTKAKAYAAGGLAASAAPFAFAQDSAFDPAAITAKITENTGIAVGIVGALILGVWTLRSMGILKRGG
ncbi:hypothetical protein LY625_01735 [Lysobacter sp. GX 14042]|uniref:hypothetical protein n=1 Tax=Lysobacter sp. GX 14042 TaxID=2907155 RepID=UPI001F433C76|nr:hypothetical protein [Lysobacter sp. GX 14042]MCE7031358.1 hypothetical protein [Lysobacter sp. GX 14042]